MITTKQSFSKAVRRIHLYMTLLCLPWFIMYGVTALAFSHSKWFSAVDDLYNLSSPNWSKVETWPHALQLPVEDGEVPREVGAELLQVANLQVKAFSVGRWGQDQLAVYIGDVWQIRRLMYNLKTQELSLYRHAPDLRVFLTLLHSRAGYQHDSLAHDTWAVMVDIVSVGILIWVASGLYMWWQQRRMRVLGLFALGLGVTTFAAFLLAL